MRAFVAVPLEAAPGPGAPAGPIEHLTLHFLGEVSEATLRAVRERLPPVVAAHPRFSITVAGVGAFPSPERPRVVWRDVTLGREELVRLAGDVRQADVAAGAPEEGRPFVPHLTWLRVRGSQEARSARDLLEGRLPPPPPLRADVTEVWLVVSRLSPTGAEHRPVARFPLGPGPA